jgi:hypothetical protein
VPAEQRLRPSEQARPAGIWAAAPGSQRPWRVASGVQYEQLEGAAHREVLELRQHPDGRYSSTRPQRVELPSGTNQQVTENVRGCAPSRHDSATTPPGHQPPTSWSTRRRTVGGVLTIVVERLPLGCRVRGSDRIMRSTGDVRRANSAVRRRARAQTRSRRSGAASAERRRWPCWRRCGLVSRGERRGSPGRPGRVRRG